jgi:predicted anti-sigma-YlaC factor YlaD
MGPVNDDVCEQWRGLIAMRALGELASDDATALDAHLEGCADCRAVADELASTVSMLAYVDVASIEPTALVPPELSARVLGDLHRAAAMDRRRRRIIVSGASLVGAIAAALILFAVVSGTSPTTNERTMALHGLTSVTAKAVLVNQSWGTTVDFSESGLPGGGVYTVSMKTATGAWWTAGTYRSVSGRTVNATMACAVGMKNITGLRVENSKGVTVLASTANAVSYQ